MQRLPTGATKRVEEVFTASESDVMRDTDLRQAPGPGALGFWAASDVVDSQISIRVGGIAPQSTFMLRLLASHS